MTKIHNAKKGFNNTDLVLSTVNMWVLGLIPHTCQQSGKTQPVIGDRMHVLHDSTVK